jgi:hypothetical protein
MRLPLLTRTSRITKNITSHAIHTEFIRYRTASAPCATAGSRLRVIIKRLYSFQAPEDGLGASDYVTGIGWHGPERSTSDAGALVVVRLSTGRCAARSMGIYQTGC